MLEKVIVGKIININFWKSFIYIKTYKGVK